MFSIFIVFYSLSFEFLIKKWSHEYGAEFMKYLLGTIAVSRDGMQENAINDFLRFLEEKRTCSNHRVVRVIAFKSSFAFVYETLCPFFAGLGSGKIRFFHDQLNTLNLTETFNTQTNLSILRYSRMIHYLVISRIIYSFLCEHELYQASEIQNLRLTTSV